MNKIMSKKDALAKIVDMKLTRNELIEFVLEEMTSDLKKEIGEIDRELHEIEAKTWSFDEVMPFLKDARFCLYVFGQGSLTREEAHLSFLDGTNDVNANNPIFDKHIEHRRELMQKRNDLQQQIYNLESNRRAFKVNVTKQILESSKEGQDLLSQLKNLKSQVRKQLASAKK